MPVKSPNHYGDRGRQTAADAAGRAANCSCNWTYFTQASENLACLTAALVRSLHPLFLLLLSSPLLRQLCLTLAHTHSYNWGCFFTLSRNPREPWSWPTCNYSIFRVSSKRHSRPGDMARSGISKNGLRDVKMEKQGGWSPAKFGQARQHNPELFWHPFVEDVTWKLNIILFSNPIVPLWLCWHFVIIITVAFPVRVQS